MHTVEDILLAKNYAKCPLKKRPVNYQFESKDDERQIKDKVVVATESSEPEDLCLKKDKVCATEVIVNHNNNNITIAADPTLMTSNSSTEELINVVSDCCEDEGVDVDHTTSDEDDMLDMDMDCDVDDDDHDEVEDDDDEEECVDVDDVADTDDTSPNQTQAAALAAAAAVAASAAAAAAASVVVPTPTYPPAPKYGLQPWNFHMSPYTAEFYRTINNPHLAAAQQMTPIRGELLSPSSPSDSIGSLSPPPHHYLHGRASSVSPPMRTELIHRPISMRQLGAPPPPQSSHQRFMPYAALPGYQYHQQAAAAVAAAAAYPALGSYTPHAPTQHPHLHHHSHHHHHAPISPAYSETSYYSMRSLTPESSCSSSLPEDLSLKHKTSSSNNSAPIKCNSSNESNVEVTSKQSTGSNSSSSTNASPTKKDKSAPPRYQCPDCQKSYSTFSGLTKHQQFHCPAAEGNQVKKSFSCKDCDKTYVSLGALKMHIRTHTLPCKCNICGKAFSRPWLLQGHIRTHTGEKPFSCQHCHRAFADRSNLRAHLQTHSDIKKYSCTNCSKTFSRMSLLTKHSEGGCPGGNGSHGNNVPPTPEGLNSCASSYPSLPPPPPSSSSVVYAEH